MARRKSRTSATGGNLDSMLDTLTNVVGILVIVLVAVQLSSQEAASKIASQIEKVDPQEVARLEKEAADARTLAAAAADALRQHREALTDPRAELAQREVKLAVENEVAQQAEARAAELAKKRAADVAAEKQAATASAAERARQEQERKTAEQRLEKTRKELENLPVPEALLAKEVRLPDPRPAPSGVKELRVLCREGRIHVVDIEALQEKAKKRADFVVKSKKLDPDGDTWLADGETFVEEFNKMPVKEGSFEMTLALEGRRWPRLVLDRTRGRGESADDAVKTTGEFARALRRFKPDTHIVRFYVWPDSFAEYLEVREFSGERGFAAGWDPVGSPEEHRIPLGKYAVGQKPPPAPPGTKQPPAANVVD